MYKHCPFPSFKHHMQSIQLHYIVQKVKLENPHSRLHQLFKAKFQLESSFAICIVLFYFFIFYLVSSFISAMCCDLMSIVQVAFVNPLINELCMYVWFEAGRRPAAS